MKATIAIVLVIVVSLSLLSWLLIVPAARSLTNQSTKIPLCDDISLIVDRSGYAWIVQHKYGADIALIPKSDSSHSIYITRLWSSGQIVLGYSVNRAIASKSSSYFSVDLSSGVVRHFRSIDDLQDWYISLDPANRGNSPKPELMNLSNYIKHKSNNK